MTSDKMVVFFFLAYNYVSAQPSQLRNAKDSLEFRELSEEYLRLTLVEDLWMANVKTYTNEGRKWLYDWREARDVIEKKIMYTIDKETIRYKLYDDWRERVKRFEDIKEDYYRSLLRYPITDETKPWPKITFDPVTAKTIIFQDLDDSRPLYTDENLDFNDPLATEKQIDQVLRYHRPYTDEEKIQAKKAHETREAESLAAGTFFSDISNNHLRADTRNFYRSQLRKYPIFQENKIKNLITSRYELMKRSYVGKRLSKLHYDRAVFQVDRVINEMKLWDRMKINRRTKDWYFFHAMPTHLRLINSNEAYRGYLNADEPFFPGNVLYGYKHRYDDPKAQYFTYEFGFEITAERILGSAYEPMFKLAKDMHELEIFFNDDNNYIKNFNDKKLEMKNLVAVDLLLKRYELLTFWNKQWSFSNSHWFFVKFPDPNRDSYTPMIVPKRYKDTVEEGWFTEVQKTLDKANDLIDHRRQKDSPISKDAGKEWLKILNRDLRLARLTNIYERRTIDFGISRELMNFVESLRRANLLSLLSPETVLNKLSLSLTKSSFTWKKKKQEIHDDDETLTKIKLKDDEPEVKNIHEFFNPETNREYSNNNDESRAFSLVSETRRDNYGSGGDGANGYGNSNHLSSVSDTNLRSDQRHTSGNNNNNNGKSRHRY